MKELQERIEECLARLKELPVLIHAEREAMNGKAAIEELKTRLKGLWLGYLHDAKNVLEMDKDTKKTIIVYPNEKAREGYALSQAKTDDEYQQLSEEIKRYEHQRNTATTNHESLVKEHSGLISTVDVLREMLKIEFNIWNRNRLLEDRMAEVRMQKEGSELEVKIRTEIQEWAKEQEASNEKG